MVRWRRILGCVLALIALASHQALPGIHQALDHAQHLQARTTPATEAHIGLSGCESDAACALCAFAHATAQHMPAGDNPVSDEVPRSAIGRLTPVPESDVANCVLRIANARGPPAA